MAYTHRSSLGLRNRQVLSNTIFHIIVWAVGFFMVYPVLWMLSNSFKTSQEIFSSGGLLPKTFTFDNYIRGWRFTGRYTFTTFFLNSFYYSIMATLASVLSSSLIAFGFARTEFPGRKFWYGCMIATLLIPFQVIMVPQFILFFRLGWINSFLPLVIPLLGGLPFFIFLIVQFIRSIPMDLDDAAKIDGCNKFMIYYRIILPLIVPALITCTIFSFYWRWDDFMGPLLYLNRPKLYTVSMALRMFSDPQSATDWPAIFAMGSLSILPILIIFVLFQKYIVQGIATTGLK